MPSHARKPSADPTFVFPSIAPSLSVQTAPSAKDAPSSPFPWSTQFPASPSVTPSPAFPFPSSATETTSSFPSRAPGLLPIPSKRGSTGSDSSLEAPATPRTPTGFEFLDKGEGIARPPRNFDWEIHGSYSPNFTLTEAGRQTFKRRLGPTEVSYYLGSRGEGDEDGVNDMYLHIGFKASPALMQPERVLAIWTELIRQHTLLAARIEYEGYEDVRFVYSPPHNMGELVARAAELSEVRLAQPRDEFLDAYLNGDRTLNDDRLAYLAITTPEATNDASSAEEQEYDFWLFTTHFLGDGMALHTTANEFFTLLGASKEGSDVQNIEAVLAAQSADAAAAKLADVEDMAQAMECKLVTPESWGRLAWTAAQVEFENYKRKLIGGQAFLRNPEKKGRHTVVPTIQYDAATTKKALGTCKAHGATIAQAVFALVNVAHIQSTEKGMAKGQRNEELPTMIYAALNVRQQLKGAGDWFHIAISYYNIILPTFLAKDLSLAQSFWYRALMTRQQTSKVIKSKLLTPRAKLMALERERRAIGFEKMDEAKRVKDAAAKKAAKGPQDQMVGLGLGFAGLMTEEPLPVVVAPPAPVVVVAPVVKKAAPSNAAPSVALMGISMLGNLDGMYKHANFTGVTLHTLTTGSRQRPGAILLFAYTFAGKLFFSLGYDKNGFADGVIENWWDKVQEGVNDFLIENKA